VTENSKQQTDQRSSNLGSRRLFNIEGRQLCSRSWKRRNAWNRVTKINLYKILSKITLCEFILSK